MKLSYRTRINGEILAKAWGKPIDKPDWYSIQSAGDQAEILIYDVIGWPWVEAEYFVRDLADLDVSNLIVRINSPGGDVFDGIAIYHALRQHKAKVTTRIEGIAASIASIIALAGDEVHAYNATRFMIHEPWSCICGDQYEMRDVAEILGKISADLIEIYSGRSKVGKSELRSMLRNETWFTADEAKENGFVDQVVDSGKPVEARFDLSIYSNVPDDLDEGFGGRELSRKEVERALRNAGATREFARAAAAKGRAADGDDGIIAALTNLNNAMRR
jgi:ATP-dependent Clp endopeptidase proteolytic subunit ClpP